MNPIRSLLVAALVVSSFSGIVAAQPMNPVDNKPRPESEQSRIAEAKLQQQKMQAIQMEILRQRQASFDVTIREINKLQAQHHELMKEIIRNIGPTGRYEYNPATGRYDRWVPYR